MKNTCEGVTYFFFSNISLFDSFFSASLSKLCAKAFSSSTKMITNVSSSSSVHFLLLDLMQYQIQNFTYNQLLFTSTDLKNYCLKSLYKFQLWKLWFSVVHVFLLNVQAILVNYGKVSVVHLSTKTLDYWSSISFRRLCFLNWLLKSHLLFSLIQNG